MFDPLEEEEEAADGYILIAGNSYREITSVHVSGQAIMKSEIVMKCCSNALERIKNQTTDLKAELAADKARRESAGADAAHIGFSYSQLIKEKTFALTERYKPGKVKVVEGDEIIVERDIPMAIECEGTKVYRFGTASDLVEGVGEGGPNQWDVQDIEDDDVEDADMPEPLSPVRRIPTKRVDSSDDEEITELTLE